MNILHIYGLIKFWYEFIPKNKMTNNKILKYWENANENKHSIYSLVL